MKIAIIGAGAIGSSLAVLLHRHAPDCEVTLVARNKRLEQLVKDGGVRARDTHDARSGVQLVPVSIRGALDPAEEYDLVMVLVLAHQVDAALRNSLTASKARAVLFLFGTIRPLSEYRDIVSQKRFAFGFPASIQAWWGKQGELEYYATRAESYVTDERWAILLRKIGIHCRTLSVPEMQAYARTQAAILVSLVAATTPTLSAGRGATWRETHRVAKAMHEWWAILHEREELSVARNHRISTRIPTWLWAIILWRLSRVEAVRSRLTNSSLAEPHSLHDEFATLVGVEQARRVAALRLVP